jgi:membrane peptidoglycan carboxypeptidase
MTPKLTLKRMTRFVLSAVAAGAVVAVLLVPLGAAAGWGMGYASGSYAELPLDLQTPATAQTSYLYANDGKTLITTFYDQDRRDVPLSQVAKVMQQAIVAAEDSRFYQHNGVDIRGILRALVANSTSGQVEQGASTLTMQYVRNVLKNDPSLTAEEQQAATAETPGRKIREARYALALEQKLSKQEILERYLNISYYGAGAYGISAASERYFSKPPSKLTLAEAALLAGLVQSPDTENPIDGDRNAALARRAYVLESMARDGVISVDEATAAKATKLVLKPKTKPNNCTAVSKAHNDWGFYCDYLRSWWESQPAFGATAAARRDALNTGGYVIVSALDPKTQATAVKQSTGVYGYNSPRALPIATVQNGTGRVLALAVNRHYSLAKNPKGQKNYPNTVNQLIAGGPSANGYQAGSSFKMFTMLAALEAGRPLDTGFVAPARIVTNYPASGKGSCNGKWCPENASPTWMDGYRNMWTGFGRSVNTYFVWLEQKIGAQNAVAMAKRLGITFRSTGDANQAKNAEGWGSFTLGVSATTPLDVANAYATLGAEGMYCKPLPVTSIKDSAGRAVAAANPSCTRVLSPDIARAATDAARCPVGQQSYFFRCDGGTAGGLSWLFGGRQIAGKTGSADNYATETFVGFTRQVAAAGIAANPDNPRDAVGSFVSAQVNEAVARTMVTALDGLPQQNFTAPSRDLAYGEDGRYDPPPAPPKPPAPTGGPQSPGPQPTGQPDPQPTSSSR